MDIIEIKSGFNGRVLYSCEAQNIKDCLLKALKTDINLEGADLRGADLRGANLRDANLRDAYLRGANLEGANLEGANLRGAYLRGANLRDAYLRDAYLRDAYLRDAYLRDAYLRGAYLRGAYLRGAYLRGANLRDAYLREGIKINKTPIQLDALTYYVTIWDSHLQIGCEFHAIKDWFSYDNKRIAEMGGKKALEFWGIWKEPLMSICKANDRV